MMASLYHLRALNTPGRRLLSTTVARWNAPTQSDGGQGRKPEATSHPISMVRDPCLSLYAGLGPGPGCVNRIWVCLPTRCQRNRLLSKRPRTRHRRDRLPQLLKRHQSHSLPRLLAKHRSHSLPRLLARRRCHILTRRPTTRHRRHSIQRRMALPSHWRDISLNILDSNINLRGHPLSNSNVFVGNMGGSKVTVQRRRNLKMRAVDSALPCRRNSTLYTGPTRKTSKTGTSSVMS